MDRAFGFEEKEMPLLTGFFPLHSTLLSSRTSDWKQPRTPLYPATRQFTPLHKAR